MKKLSYWARQHSWSAISLIIILEIIKGWIGVRFGFRFLPALPGLLIELSVVAIAIGALAIEKNYFRQAATPFLTKTGSYDLRVRSSFYLFTASFILSIVLGNRCQHFVTPQKNSFSVWAASSRVEGAIDGVENQKEINPDNHRSTRLTRKALREERRLSRQKHNQRPANADTAAYILLFLVGVGLAFLGAGLACNLSCSNQGLAAVLVGLLALGAFAGGIYFLVKAFRRKSPKTSSSIN
ncbi:hypothetical protein [Spirosoma endbachense]|uniref:Uncharacterized protein n=1 Tax=Spirosoma endbachense TaxID=2666025 RepID=A0A6P1VSV4_9BACT|nr:hypothetical protein [Spirosoma endbachense]QHV95182.1 hypothetical protein GJR95_09235 [Spirosoma endbachense]